ncbi:MAG TPA: alpha/beta hydrolase, partial [Phytomonospora sp.]
MAPFVLVHSPLVGPLSWVPVAEILGAGTVVPLLAGAGGPPYYPAFARAIADAAPDGAILVAHSGAGALLSLAADLAEEDGRTVAGLIYVD